jgi:hypothetical protein
VTDLKEMPAVAAARSLTPRRGKRVSARMVAGSWGNRVNRVTTSVPSREDRGLFATWQRYCR